MVFISFISTFIYILLIGLFFRFLYDLDKNSKKQTELLQELTERLERIEHKLM
jgi:uncharacterized membrane protein YqhA